MKRTSIILAFLITLHPSEGGAKTAPSSLAPLYQKKAAPCLERLTPHERLMCQQLRLFFKRALYERGVAALSTTEQLILHLMTNLGLYTGLRCCISPSVTTLLLAADNALAYSHYEQYQAAGSYPSCERIGFPSITLTTTLLLSSFWQALRTTVEYWCAGEHQSLDDLITAAHKKELKGALVEQLIDGYKLLRCELVERGLADYLPLAGHEVDQAYSDLEHLLEYTDYYDYRVIFRIIHFIRRARAFAQEPPLRI